MRGAVDAFVAGLRDDPRIVGIARRPEGETSGELRILLVTTWDGFEPLVAALPRLGARLLALDGGSAHVGRVDGASWAGLSDVGTRAWVGVRRVADLKPSAEGANAVALFDPRGWVEHWTRSCAAQDPADDDTDPRRDEASRVAGLLDLDDFVRAIEPAARETPPSWIADRLRQARDDLEVAGVVEAALAARIDRLLELLRGTGRRE